MAFVDTSKEVKELMSSLSKKGLRKAGRLIIENTKPLLPKKSGNTRKSLTSWARINREGVPLVSVGYLTKAKMMKKHNIKHWANPAWLETGTKVHLVKSGFKRGTKTNSKVLFDRSNNISFGMNVKHPGIRRRETLRTITYNMTADIQKIMATELYELNIAIDVAKSRLGKDDEEP